MGGTRPRWASTPILVLVAVLTLATGGWLLVRAGNAASGGPASGGPASGGATRGDVAPEAYGAAGDGTRDDTAALQAALDAVPPRGRLVLAAGRTYAHGDVLHVRVDGTTLTGGGRLLATRPQRSAVQVDADDVTLAGITLACAPPDRRYTAYEQMKLRVSAHRGLTVTDVTVQRSAAAGIFLEGVEDFVLRDVRISDTEADGIHLTGGSRRGTILRPVVARPGDDGVAVVSYASDPAPTEQIRVTSPTVTDQRWGRGLSVVGGRGIRYEDVTVDGSAGAAVYIATEGAPYFTRSVSDVSVIGGRITQANTHPSIGHSALLVAAGQPGTSISRVTLEGLTVMEPPGGGRTALALRCDPGPVWGVAVRGVTVSRSYAEPYESSCGTPDPLDVRPAS